MKESTNIPKRPIIILGLILLIVALVYIFGADKLFSMNKVEPVPEIASPRIVVVKSQRKLELYDGEKLIKTYRIVLGNAPNGDKEREGDGKTPEGEFYVFGKNPESKFHLSLGLSYPSTDNAQRGIAAGLIDKNEKELIDQAIAKGEMPPQKTALGGEIFIHGGGAASDWTEGCIALENADIEELFAVISKGVPVKIIP